MKKWAELVVNLGLSFWTKKRVLFILAAYAADRLFLGFAFPVALLPTLATLALFDYKAGKFPELRGKLARQKLVLIALSCTLPLIALWLVELVISGLNSLWHDFLFTAKIVWDLLGIHFPSAFVVAWSTFVENLLTTLANLFSAITQPLTWVCVFWICLPIVATERKVDHAMVRAYLYGFALSLIPALTESAIVGLFREWGLGQPPSQKIIAFYSSLHCTVKVSSASTSPIPIWASEAITSFVRLVVWGGVAFLLLWILPRLRFLQDESS